MPVQQIVNAMPQAILNGADDLSTQPPVIVPEQVPSHLPKFGIWAQQGPLDDQLVVGNSMLQMYGSASFDERGAYATHATPLVNAISAAANQMIIRRLQPADAPKPAAVRLYLDVLGPIAIQEIARNSDGSYQLDPQTGLPIPGTGTVQGYKVKFVTAPIGVDTEGNDLFGQGTEIAGDQTDVTTTTQSKRYPIWDADVPSFGKQGNNNAVRFYAPTALSSQPLDTRVLTDELVYPVRVQFATRPDANTSPSVTPLLTGDQFIDVCFVPGTIDKNTDQQLYIGAQVPSAWQDINDASGVPNTYGPFGRFFTYDSVVAGLVEQFYTAEFPVAGTFSDFTGAENEQNLFNFVGGVSSQNVPYHSYVFNTADGNAVRLSPNTNIYAVNGGDGTMNNANYETAVAAMMAEYADPNNPIQDPIGHPESHFYDTGFTLATKKLLGSFIANRKDTFVVLGTHDASGPALTASQESSVGLSLSTMLSAYPESDVYGTPVCRGLVFAGSGNFLGNGTASLYGKPLPLTLELGVKSAKYMGAANGVWKSTANFDRAPLSVIQYFSNINVTFVPATQGIKDWGNGIVRVRKYSRNAYFVPGLKTVYPDDTSVLNSYFTACGVGALEKICVQSWQEYSGESSLTDEQLVAGVDGFIADAVLGKFDNRFVVQSQTTVTGKDAQRGFSWTTVVSLYANNMRTVGQFTINTLRMSQLQTTLQGGSAATA